MFVCNRQCQQVPKDQPNENPKVKSQCDTTSCQSLKNKSSPNPTMPPVPTTPPFPTTPPAVCNDTGPVTNIRLNKKTKTDDGYMIGFSFAVIVSIMVVIFLSMILYKSIKSNGLPNNKYYLIGSIIIVLFLLISLILGGVYLSSSGTEVNALLVKENSKCSMGDEFVGDFETLDECAQNIYDYGGYYFNYGNKKCYKQNLGKNEECSNLSPSNDYNFYKMEETEKNKGLYISFIIFYCLAFLILLILIFFKYKSSKNIGNVRLVSS